MYKKLYFLKIVICVIFYNFSSAQETLDQSNVNTDGGSGINTSATDMSMSIYQTFRAGLSGPLSKVSCHVTYLGNINISIMATDSNGLPTGPKLCQVDVPNNNTSFVDAIFANPINVTAGTTYAIKLEKNGNYHVYYSNTDAYLNGKMYYTTSTTPTPTIFGFTYIDLGFKTYVDNSLSVATSIIKPSCFNISDGSATINPTNGIAPYTYVWTSSVSGFVAPATSSNSITNVLAGTYTCLVTDSSTPTVRNKTVTITITQPEAYDAYIKADATCSTNNLTIEPILNTLVSNDFNANNGFILSGNASYNSASGNVMLVPDLVSQNGRMTLNLPATIPADFETSFRVYMKDKDGADGFSFNIGSEIPVMTEDGTNIGLAFRFKTYLTERLSAFWNGTQIGNELSFGTDRTLQSGKWNDIKIRVVGGKLSFFINGNPVVLNTTIPGYTMNNSYKAIFAGRCGGAYNEILIDDFVFGNPIFEYSIDGTTYQTSNVFNNITLPANNTLPIWLRQNGCAIKVRDFIYPVTKLPATFTATTAGCSPTQINVVNPDGFKPKVYNNNFSSKNGYTLGGDAKNTANGVLLNKNQRYTRGYMIIDKPASINNDFEMIVKHQSLNKNGADGFSINFGNPSAIINHTNNYENGVSTGLAIRCKTFGQDNVTVFYDGLQIGTAANTNFETGDENTITVSVINNGISVSLNGNILINNQGLPVAYSTLNTSNYKFIIASRTGGGSNENLIKNVSIANPDGLEYSINNSTTYTALSTQSINTTTIPITSADYPTGIVNLNVRFRFINCPFANSPIAVTANIAPLDTFTQSGNLLTADETNPNATYKWYYNECNPTPPVNSPISTTNTCIANNPGIYRVEVTLNGCGVFGACQTVTVLQAPTATDQAFCSGATVANLVANPSTGNTIKWYNVATGGTALASTTVLVSGNYYASQTNGTSESTRTSITVTVNPSPTAPSAAAQSFCGETSVANLTATATSGNTLKWYNVATGGTQLTSTTTLSTGTYYVSQTNGTCESTRTAVTVTVSSTPSAPTANAQQTYCNDFFVSDLEATATSGNTLRWYNVATGGTPLAGSTSLVAGTYYVSQINGTCEGPRTAVQVTLVPYPAAPTANAQSLCSGARVSDLVATGESGNTLFWYNSATATNSLAPFTVLSTGTYYVEQLNSASCNSPRTAVSVTINSIPSAPTGNSSQTFVNGAIVANLVVSPANVTWFANLTDAQNGTNPLATTTQLVNNSTYYAVITENGCRSNSFGVTVSLTLSNSNFELEKNVKLYPNPTTSLLNIDLGEYTDAIVTLVDINGRILLSKKVAKTSFLDLRNFSTGIYILKIENEKGSISKKIIKE